MVGKVLQALQKHGFAENTLIIFSADNGAETHAFERLQAFNQWSSGEYRGVKRDLYEGGHRVPMIMRWPGKIQPGSVSHEVVSQVDFAATFAHITGYKLNKKEAMDSYNLLPVLEGEPYPIPLRHATVQNTKPQEFAIRQGDWVLINTSKGSAKKEPSAYLQHFALPVFGPENTCLLFNLKKDPRQKHNLADKYPQRVESMKAILEKYLNGLPCAPVKEK
jgi:arylsulfatase A-like enzyme